MIEVLLLSSAFINSSLTSPKEQKQKNLSPFVPFRVNLQDEPPFHFIEMGIRGEVKIRINTSHRLSISQVAFAPY
jgi:hypothetical protein